MTALSISIWVYLCSWVIIDLLSSHTTWCCCIAGPSCARILERPVFVDPSIISLVCLLGLKYTISGALHSIFLTVVKACSHSSDHVNLAFFMVRAQRGAVLLENFVPLGISFALGSMDPQTFPKCPFLLQRLQMTLQALQQPVCGTFSPQNVQILIVFLVCFLPSWSMVVVLSIVKYGICSSGIIVRLESIVFQEIHFFTSSNDWSVETSLARSISFWITDDCSFSECVCNFVTNFVASCSPIFIKLTILHFSSQPSYPMIMGLITVDWLSAEEFKSFSS